MKNLLIILIILTVVLGGFCVLSFQTGHKVAVKADEKTGNMFAFEQSVEGMYDKVQGMVAEGYSEPDEDIKDRKEHPEKQGILSRLLNLVKR